MVGIQCAKATTTFKIVEVPDQDVIGLQENLKTFYREKWSMTPERAAYEAELQLLDISNICRMFPVGTILERRGNSIRPRR